MKLSYALQRLLYTHILRRQLPQPLTPVEVIETALRAYQWRVAQQVAQQNVLLRAVREKLRENLFKDGYYGA